MKILKFLALAVIATCVQSAYSMSNEEITQRMGSLHGLSLIPRTQNSGNLIYLVIDTPTQNELGRADVYLNILDKLNNLQNNYPRIFNALAAFIQANPTSPIPSEYLEQLSISPNIASLHTMYSPMVRHIIQNNNMPSLDVERMFGDVKNAAKTQ